jgi:glycosyltransferase involved in cell wall biosynthesis
MTTSQKHLAFIVPTLGSGGAERAVANLSSELARRGHKISVFVLRAGGAYEATMDPAVTVVNLNAGKARQIIFNIGSVLKKHKVDTIFTVLFHINLYLLLSRLLTGWKTQIVACYQNTPSVVAQSSASGSEKVLMAVYRKLARSADRHFAISQGVAQDAQSYFGLQGLEIPVISNPIVDDKAAPVSPVDLKGLFSQPVDAVIIASGRLTKQKDYPTMLKALQRVRERRNVGLVILGTGELRDQIQALAEEIGLSQFVHFAGFQKSPLDWMAGADLFLLSSQWEGLANVVVEALSLGLKVVSTDCPYGPREILLGGALGALTPVGDDAALAVAIDHTLEQAHDPAAATRRAQDFSIRAIADQYEKELFPEAA